MRKYNIEAYERISFYENIYYDKKYHMIENHVVLW